MLSTRHKAIYELFAIPYNPVDARSKADSEQLGNNTIYAHHHRRQCVATVVTLAT